MGPILTLLGLQFANLLAGAIVVENVFYLPGLGRLLFQAIANRDLLVVQNGVLLLVAMVIVVNFWVDVLHAWLDPRVRLSGAGRSSAMNATRPPRPLALLLGGLLTTALVLAAALSWLWTPPRL